MSKAIFLNFPTHGCINSLLATAKELVDRGEKIIYNKFTSEELYENTDKLISDSVYKKKALEYKAIFNEEEIKSHIEAADKILFYIKKQL